MEDLQKCEITGMEAFLLSAQLQWTRRMHKKLSVQHDVLWSAAASGMLTRWTARVL